MSARCQHNSPWYSECWRCREEDPRLVWTVWWDPAKGCRFEIGPNGTLLVADPTPYLRIRNEPHLISTGWAHLAERFKADLPTTPVLRTHVGPGGGIPVLYQFPLGDLWFRAQVAQAYDRYQSAMWDFYEASERGWAKVAKAMKR